MCPQRYVLKQLLFFLYLHLPYMSLHVPEIYYRCDAASALRERFSIFLRLTTLNSKGTYISASSQTSSITKAIIET